MNIKAFFRVFMAACIFGECTSTTLIESAPLTRLCEVKTLNHRHVTFRLPCGFEAGPGENPAGITPDGNEALFILSRTNETFIMVVGSVKRTGTTRAAKQSIAYERHTLTTAGVVCHPAREVIARLDGKYGRSFSCREKPMQQTLSDSWLSDPRSVVIDYSPTDQFFASLVVPKASDLRAAEAIFWDVMRSVRFNDKQIGSPILTRDE